MDMLNVASTGMYTILALFVNFKENACKKMNVIAKISCCLERGVVTLKLRKEYWNSVTHTTSVLLRIKYWTVWCIERYSMSTYTGVTNCVTKNSPVFFGPPCTFVAQLRSSLMIVELMCAQGSMWSMTKLSLTSRQWSRLYASILISRRKFLAAGWVTDNCAG